MSFDARALRDALGTFATGVCLVSLVDERGVAHALTVNSFASVSLDPPLVLWSLQKDSDTYPLYAEAPRYSIATLAASRKPVDALRAKGWAPAGPEHFDPARTARR
jgi:flavin reductase (DIM6/NTAB) family NADH-FMN oxidoreductase RutF